MLDLLAPGRRLIRALGGATQRRQIARDVLFVLTAAIGHFPSARLRHLFYCRFLGLRLGAGARINGGAEIRPGKIEIGDHTVVGHNAILDGRRGLVIGRSVNLSSDVAVWTLQHDPQDPEFGDKGGAVVIEDRVWLSFRSTILPGVRIGEGAVVAANAVVTSDVAPFTIVGGIPAVKIGDRRRDLTYRLETRRHLV